MARNKITYYKLLTPELQANEEARAARIAAGLPLDNPEEAPKQQEEEGRDGGGGSEDGCTGAEGREDGR